MNKDILSKIDDIHEALLGTLEKPGGLFARVVELAAQVQDLKERFIVHEADTRRRLDELEKVEGTRAKRYIELILVLILTTLVNQALNFFKVAPH